MVSEEKYDGPTSNLKSNGVDLYSGQQAYQMHAALHMVIETRRQGPEACVLMMKAEM